MKKLLFGLIAGISAGLLFAPKSGKNLRKELRKSDSKFTAFGQALRDAAKDVGDEAKGVLNSKDVQEMIASGKKSAEDLLALLETKSEEMSTKARKELDRVLGIAIDKAEHAEDTIDQTAENVAKTTQKKTTAAKKLVVGKARSAVKTAKKKLPPKKSLPKTAGGIVARFQTPVGPPPVHRHTPWKNRQHEESPM